MKTVIITLTYLFLSTASYAQGIFTDPNTGFTLEYPSEWVEFKMVGLTGIYCDDGLIGVTSDADDEPMQPEEFRERMESNKDIVNMFLKGALGDNSKISDYGTMYFAGKDSYYFIATIKEGTDSDELHDLDMKMIITIIGNYTNRVSIITAKSQFDEFVIKAEELLSGAYFKE